MSGGSFGTEAPSDRFEIREKLGAGGMGAVYRAFDYTRNIEVALKTLVEMDPRAIYRFKREFRTLCDVVHPNLVTLYELHTVDDEWFFTMELIDGCSFTDWVRPCPHDAADGRPEATVTRTGVVDRAGDTMPTGVYRPAVTSERRRVLEGKLSPERLHDALVQLADGVYALHRAGKLHRDLKPSNVLVDHAGHVVLLDFGLASDIHDLDIDATHGAGAVGTPVYMSPEQAADAPLTPASDWYSVGVMLYEALTGRRPLESHGKQIGTAKQVCDPPPPSTLADDVPAELDALCMQMLDRDPAQRPDGAAVLAALGGKPSRASIDMNTTGPAPEFVGRTAELEALREGFAACRNASSVTFYIRGESGMGKSALVHRFLSEFEGTDAIVLSGRCYERESVPYKALDAVVDALSRQLLRLPADEVEAIMPREIIALAKLFPVLKRVRAISEPNQRRLQSPDPQELRRRAFGALRYLLHQLAATRPVVVFIDDLQWGDVDSARFLIDVIHHPAPPQILLLLCYRVEDEQTSPLLSTLRAAEATSPGGSAVHELTLSALSENEAALLLRPAADGKANPERVNELWRESGGSPLFLSELLRAGGAGLAGSSLDDLLALRIARLGDDAKELLRACAVAGRPTSPELLARAAGLPGAGSALEVLRNERLIRVRPLGDGGQSIEPYHDRIRENVVARLDADALREVHRHMARAIEASDHLDAEALVEHWLSANEVARAGNYAVQAGDAASELLAFHHAADFYALALKHKKLDADAQRALLARYADALTNAGRLDDAADAYARAAEGADDDTRIMLGHLEFEQLLRRGHLERGIAKTREVLAQVGLSLPRTRRGALLSIIWHRAKLKLRGMKFRQRDTPLPDEQARRLQVLWSASTALGYVVPFFGKAIQMRFVRQALDSGDPSMAAMGLTMEQAYLGLSGQRSRRQAEKLRKVATELAERSGDKKIVGMCLTAGGVCSFLSGNWQEALGQLRDGEQLLLNYSRDVRWVLDIGQIVGTSALVYMGQFGELTRMVPLYLREAEERGDDYAARGLRGWRTNVTWLALDRPDDARAQVEAVATEGSFHLHHYYEMLARCQIELYRDAGARAHERIESLWKQLDSSMLLRIQSVLIEGNHLRARAALAAADGNDPDKLRIATRAARAIEREDTHWGAPLARLVRAAVHHRRGDDDAAADGLRAAAGLFEAADMTMYAAACRHQLGRLLAGDEGRALCRNATEWCESESIANPVAMIDMYAPGFADS